ncbi:hypothetical protein HLK66_15915 [Niallia circulans]|uniref:hypothetical protein n=1 Tax=Niallia circulans TaxID=1397 RepID=UPI001490716B|nr:hypothetical protein [Niallia circulans]QJX62996.1 hypothetical protein HLK66_15915 [Niallia circulans]
MINKTDKKKIKKASSILLLSFILIFFISLTWQLGKRTEQEKNKENSIIMEQVGESTTQKEYTVSSHINGFNQRIIEILFNDYIYLDDHEIESLMNEKIKTYLDDYYEDPDPKLEAIVVNVYEISKRYEYDDDDVYAKLFYKIIDGKPVLQTSDNLNNQEDNSEDTSETETISENESKKINTDVEIDENEPYDQYREELYGDMECGPPNYCDNGD